MRSNLQPDLLTKIERAGGSCILTRSATREQRETFGLHVHALKKLGHALSIDEVIEHGEESGDLRVIHYRSCTLCARTGAKNG